MRSLIRFLVVAHTVVVLVPAVSAQPAASLVEDVRRLEGDSNEARFEALTEMLRARGIPFSVEPFTRDKPGGNDRPAEGRNVVVALGEGSDYILVGAHYDAARLPDGALSRGAVDNGASSVLLVRLADALRKVALKTAVRIVWFDMEENGLIGSARYVEAHRTDRIQAMLNLDINGYGDTVLFGPFDSAQGRPSTRSETAALRRALLETCAAQDLPCVPFPRMPPGDDLSFTRAGIPALSLAILPAVDAHEVWLFMNAPPGQKRPPPAVLQMIHTAQDTADRLDEAGMARMLDLTTAFVRKLVN
jgi:Zn-dependent M28 family amino/carboxypeptidase